MWIDKSPPRYLVSVGVGAGQLACIKNTPMLAKQMVSAPEVTGDTMGLRCIFGILDGLSARRIRTLITFVRAPTHHGHVHSDTRARFYIQNSEVEIYRGKCIAVYRYS